MVHMGLGAQVVQILPKIGVCISKGLRPEKDVLPAKIGFKDHTHFGP